MALGGLTGRPLGLTGARVPARSAFLCSRWIRAFLEIGMVDEFGEEEVWKVEGGLK